MAIGPIANFSGGEKARLALAMIVWQRPNLLLLDEPTNHLDLETREALTVALAQFEGTLVLVSHDRHLLRATTDQFLIVADGTLQPFDGDLDDYRDWLLAGRGREAAARWADAAVLDARPQDAKTRRSRRRGSVCSELRKPLQQKIERVEQRIDLLSTEKRGLDEWLATSEAYIEENKERLIASLARRGDLAWELARDEAEWLELHEALERAAG